MSFFPLMVYVFLGELILSFWGDEFIEAYWVLILVSIGQLFNIATGPAGLLLVMCGYQKLQTYISFSTIILNILLNLFLIKFYGIYGAAIATTISLIVENLTKVFFAKKKLNVFTLPV